MADEDRTFDPTTVSANLAQQQGLGVGAREIRQEQDAHGASGPLDPERTEPFDQSLDPTTGSDRPSEADFSGQEPGDVKDADRA